MFFPHGGSYNHGCEALARCTQSMIRAVDNDAEVVLYSAFAGSDHTYGLDKIGLVRPIIGKEIDRNSLRGIMLRAKARLTKQDCELMFIGHKHPVYKDCDAAISIGGDNYCYAGMQHVLSEHTKALKYWGKPMVLWGCSLDRDRLSTKAINELKQYDAIVARESITLSTLNDIGLGEKTVIATDPAFNLPSQPTQWPDSRLNGKKVIGINISPLINHYQNGDLIMRNYCNLVRYVLQDPATSVALIPHVEIPNNSDYDVAAKLKGIVESERVVLIPAKYNCMELKSLISKCYAFVGARTHATIAAYSTKVPTLVVGYSTKSKGIARDIFGSDDGLVISVQQFDTETTLVESYQTFDERRAEIMDVLNTKIDEYAQRAYIASDLLRNKIMV